MDTGTAGTGTVLHTDTGHFDNFGTTPIPVSDTLVSSVRNLYRYREYRYRTKHTHGKLHIPVLSIRTLAYCKNVSEPVEERNRYR